MDTSDSSQHVWPIQNCPSLFELVKPNGVSAWGTPQNLSGSCPPIQFSTNASSYSQVGGRINGYQYYSINGFEGGSIDSRYMDGLSLSPWQHIWSFAATQVINGPICECGNRPEFVGNDFYCESGSNGYATNKIYTSDPLWDGQGCVSGEAACCQACTWYSLVPQGLDHFYHRLYWATVVYAGDEDTPLSLYEIYVK